MSSLLHILVSTYCDQPMSFHVIYLYTVHACGMYEHTVINLCISLLYIFTPFLAVVFYLWTYREQPMSVLVIYLYTLHACGMYGHTVITLYLFMLYVFSLFLHVVCMDILLLPYIFSCYMSLHCSCMWYVWTYCDKPMSFHAIYLYTVLACGMYGHTVINLYLFMLYILTLFMAVVCMNILW